MPTPHSSISAEAATIAHLAEHFIRLKQRALELRDTIGASERGYFTPSEDDQVRQLLVSYWHPRNALLEVITEYRAGAEDLRDDEWAEASLVALAAACLLADAARFANETFCERPVVIAKLNEPEPHFGIPAGVYDMVQKSLTDPMHAWELHHAYETYSEHEGEYRALVAARPELAPVLAVVEQLHHRLSMSVSEYAAARALVRGREIRDKLAKGPLAALMYRLQKLGGILVADVYSLPRHEPRLPRPVRRQLREILQPGDVCINRKEYAATNYFLPGYWPHGALYLGRVGELEQRGLPALESVAPRWQRLCDVKAPDDHRVLESQKDGVHLRSLESPLHCDNIAVIRPLLSGEDIITALGRAMFHEGKPYDFDFDFSRSDRLVCTEVVYRAYEGVGDVRIELTARAGRLTLSAEDLLNMAVAGRHFRPVAVYTEAYRKRLVTGEEAGQALAATL